LGIVSTNPGFIGNGPLCLITDENCDGDYSKTNVLVAIAGQVPVRFSEENGPIKVGDYLTLSSTTPGAAMKLVGSGYIVGVAIGEATSTTYYSQASDTASSTASTAMTVYAFIKNGWRDPDTKAELGTGQVPSRWLGLFDFFKTIGFEVGQNFVKITNLITDKLTAEKIETKQLCIEDVCVNKDQLQALLISANQTPVIVPPTATSTDPVATSTDPIIEDENASTTPTTITEETSAPEPEATANPETISSEPVAQVITQ
jgi:hypothetical protein